MISLRQHLLLQDLMMPKIITTTMLVTKTYSMDLMISLKMLSQLKLNQINLILKILVLMNYKLLLLKRETVTKIHLTLDLRIMMALIKLPHNKRDPKPLRVLNKWLLVSVLIISIKIILMISIKANNREILILEINNLEVAIIKILLTHKNNNRINLAILTLLQAITSLKPHLLLLL